MRRKPAVCASCAPARSCFGSLRIALRVCQPRQRVSSRLFISSRGLRYTRSNTANRQRSLGVRSDARIAIGKHPSRHQLTSILRHSSTTTATTTTPPPPLNPSISTHTRDNAVVCARRRTMASVVDKELDEFVRDSDDDAMMLVDGKDGGDADDAVMNLAADSTAVGGGGGNKRRQRKLSRQNSKENVVAASASSAAGFVQAARSWKNSRRSRNGFGRGLPKKGGAGGKGVWGLPGSELLEAYEDVNDPNYDNENMSNGDIELKAVIPDISVEEVRRKVEPVVLEYFENGDTHEAAISLSDAVPPNLRDILVQFLVEIAMDHKASHREMTSVLISDLYGQVVTEVDITKGFENLLANLGDLIIDIPDAPTVLGNFIARAIADDCIPPKFLAVMKDKSDAPPFEDALDRANILFTMKHGIVRLHNVWGVGGALRPVKYLTRQMNLLLQEYISSRDIAEATRCVRSLEVPHFHHELVYEAIVMALEANSASKEEALCTLLKSLSDAIIITPDQLEHGFLRVFEDLQDISMDVPLAYIILDRFVDRCYKEGFLTEMIIKRLPSRGRKRFVSEGDQHLIKNHKII